LKKNKKLIFGGLFVLKVDSAHVEGTVVVDTSILVPTSVSFGWILIFSHFFISFLLIYAIDRYFLPLNNTQQFCMQHTTAAQVNSSSNPKGEQPSCHCGCLAPSSPLLVVLVLEEDVSFSAASRINQYHW
jgi:hypothetical protein